MNPWSVKALKNHYYLLRKQGIAPAEAEKQACRYAFVAYRDTGKNIGNLQPYIEAGVMGMRHIEKQLKKLEARHGKGLGGRT